MPAVTRTRATRGAAGLRTHEYGRYADLAGPLLTPSPDSPRVRYHPAVSRRERLATAALILACLVSGVALIAWLLHPSRLPLHEAGQPLFAVALLAYAMVVTVEVLRIWQVSALWLMATRAQWPVPVAPPAGLRVAVLTTIVPSSEPVELVLRTLDAMTQLEYDGPVDVWILDEGDDPAVKAAAARLGVHHFSRKGHPEWNTEGGAFKARTKHGNHNAWRVAHAADYDIVAQMDPDHVPHRLFLQRTLGYFRDPDVAFVVAPQVYGNKHENWIAGGAARQSYIFHGVVQPGLNGRRIPLLIGTNHLYRVEAWEQIGGYGDSIIEDHMTWLTVDVADHVGSGRWHGVYTPDILSVGEGPSTWTDWFNQQRRWAYGMWEIVLGRGSAFLGRLSPLQRLYVASLEVFYPSVALIWSIGLTAASLSLFTGMDALNADFGQWLPWWGTNAVFQVWLFLRFKRWSLTAEERAESQASGVILALFTAPIYAAAMASALTGHTLRYVVTAKGSAATRDSLRVFRSHLGWVSVVSTALIVAAFTGHSTPGPAFWATLGVIVAGLPPTLLLLHRLRVRGQRGRGVES